MQGNKEIAKIIMHFNLSLPLLYFYINMNENTIIQEVHISQISAGDSILCHDGYVRTISKKDIHKRGFFGNTIFGNSYKNNTLLVKRVKFIVPTNNGVVLR